VEFESTGRTPACAVAQAVFGALVAGGGGVEGVEYGAGGFGCYRGRRLWHLWLVDGGETAGGCGVLSLKGYSFRERKVS
jgi:hypothetical protein